MTQPILTIKPEENKAKAIANLLPCRIHHNGPVDAASQYWKPTTAEGTTKPPINLAPKKATTPNKSIFSDGSKTAYFRGRKLHGKAIKLPEQCHGVVIERRDDTARPAGTEDEELSDPVGTMRVTADFDELVVWGHEAVADAAEDPYVRSMEEWLQVADKVRVDGVFSWDVMLIFCRFILMTWRARGDFCEELQLEHRDMAEYGVSESLCIDLDRWSRLELRSGGNSTTRATFLPLEIPESYGPAFATS